MNWSAKLALANIVVLCAATTLSADIFQIDLNYNFNGIVHAGEDELTDDPDGYRSISDRGLDFTAGTPSDAMLDVYNLIGIAGVLDIVHLGNRNTVSGGAWAFDATPDGNDVGIQPNWLADPDQSGPQTTALSTPLVLDGNSSAGVLFQISNGGGNFDVRFGFSSGADVIATLSGPDWFAGPYAGTDSVDRGRLGAAGLFITEGIIDLSAEAGRTLTSMSFENRSNTGAGYGILAANVNAIPEPSSCVVILLGLASICCRRKK